MAALRRDGARLAEVAEGRFHLPVPSCPDWTVADLVWHTGEVYGFFTSIALGEITGPEEYVEPRRPAEDRLLEWFDAALAGCAGALEVLDPAAPRWTWSAQQNAGFIQRRMAQETAVHCWDALQAIGKQEPLPLDLALDGVDEFLTHFRAAVPPPGLPASGIHLHATDGDGEWSVRPSDDGWQVTRSHGKGALAVRGLASDLLLWLWGRQTTDPLELFGDAELLPLFWDAYDRG
jgi:uncharacterized protein (TIGR03083 family)